MALEYGYTYNLPVWINRCGVLAGAGQFGTAEQGIFSYWLHAHAQRRRLGFFGFGGRGLQVRDALHPDDLATIVIRQTDRRTGARPDPAYRGRQRATPCPWRNSRPGATSVSARIPPSAMPRPGRSMSRGWLWIPRKARQAFGWEPAMTLPKILDEIAAHVETHPDWLNMAGA